MKQKENAKFEYNIKQGEARVLFKTNNLELMMHVKNYLELGENSPNDGEYYLGWVLESWLDIEKYNIVCSMVADGEDVVLEYGDKGKQLIKDSNRYVYNCRTKSVLIISGGKIVVYNNEMRNLFVDTYKALRQLISYQYIQMGAIPVHSSSIALGGQGILFVGNKRAGKTTLSVKSALMYGRLCDYLGNDRTFIYEKNNRYYLYALPTVIGIGLGMIKDDKVFMSRLLPDVHDRAGGSSKLLLDQPNIQESMSLMSKIEGLSNEECWQYGKDKVWLTPAELSVITNCKTGLVAELKYIVFPHISDESANITNMKKEVLIDVLKENILDITKVYPDWLGLDMPILCNDKTIEMIDRLFDNNTIVSVDGKPDEILNKLHSIYFAS